ncbi:nitric-oxide reductase large subunit [Campylobacter sp. RM16187]|uniref:nitric-oxide reductase large subunit n=1 Tax=Campylobacter sp. RM16187 TaxID=1660063 RepID=UPI0021B4F020|nr:nitric-oxide reductase large subunit [Campylobacter sp. RM16187]QKG29943.1 nitric oxide reductase, monomeric type [Campylobacter sp. RM16187]
MGEYKKYWLALIGVLIFAFGILGYYGVEVYRQSPPIVSFVDDEGKVFIEEESIYKGQEAWQSIGGMQLGSVWGHGAYQAPDWSADWLHKELVAFLDIKANKLYNKKYDELSDEKKAELKVMLKKEYRTNTVKNDTIVLSKDRIKAIDTVRQEYLSLFGDDPKFDKLREAYAMKTNTLPALQNRKELNDFFFWTAWATATNRPNSDVTYTNNWPHEPLIDNVPSSENIFWSVASFVILLAGIGFLVWFSSFYGAKEDEKLEAITQDPLKKLELTPSQKALPKYLFVAVALFVFQFMMGGFVAHYTVEGQEFYGIDVSQYIPYSLARTWHIQASIFWIATGFLAAGLFLAPIINGGKDPKYQKLGVDLLFYALLFLVVGSFAGQYLAIANIMPINLSFWLGHQGYEFIELGRIWQIILFVGLVIWMVLLLRGFVGGFKAGGDKNLLAIFAASAIAVGLFYGAGLFYGQRSPIPVMEYWRWWVVHLWVEGFFEVFATASLAFVFVSLGLASKKMATFATLASASIFMIGGIPGTFHHLYFSGTTTPIMAVGASFSALEVVPLVLLGYEAFQHYRMQFAQTWAKTLKWPLYCFIAVAFWNMLGAGVFGFLINPPIALFYIQGLNTTPVHAHAALFGVYGFLALGFIWLAAIYIYKDKEFNDTLMKVGFWSLNWGLMLMILTSLLPIGIYQAVASLEVGMWYARSAEFLQSEHLQMLRWIRMIGDTIFIVGGICFFIQICKFIFGKPALKA